MKLLLPTLVVSLLLTSCAAYHDGGFYPAVQLNASEANFQYVKTIEAQATATYVFGLGGASQTALIKNAKEQLYAKYELGPNEVLINYSSDFKNFWVLAPVYYQRTLIMTAEVYRIGASSDDGDSGSTGSMIEDEKDNPKVNLATLIKAGDQIYFKDREANYQKGTVKSYRYPYAQIDYMIGDESKTIQKIVREIYFLEDGEYVPVYAE